MEVGARGWTLDGVAPLELQPDDEILIFLYRCQQPSLTRFYIAKWVWLLSVVNLLATFLELTIPCFNWKIFTIFAHPPRYLQWTRQRKCAGNSVLVWPKSKSNFLLIAYIFCKWKWTIDLLQVRSYYIVITFSWNKFSGFRCWNAHNLITIKTSAFWHRWLQH